jgi:hypothetical protein
MFNLIKGIKHYVNTFLCIAESPFDDNKSSCGGFEGFKNNDGFFMHDYFQRSYTVSIIYFQYLNFCN